MKKRHLSVCFFIFSLIISGEVFASNNDLISINDDIITLDVREIPLNALLYKIKKQSNIDFSIIDKKINRYPITIKLDNIKIDKGLKRILKPFSSIILYNQYSQLSNIIVFQKSIPSANIYQVANHPGTEQHSSSTISKTSQKEIQRKQIDAPQVTMLEESPQKMEIMNVIELLEDERIIPSDIWIGAATITPIPENNGGLVPIPREAPY